MKVGIREVSSNLHFFRSNEIFLLQLKTQRVIHKIQIIDFIRQRLNVCVNRTKNLTYDKTGININLRCVIQ